MDYLAEYEKLRDSLPKPALARVKNENCDFCNYVDECKDCYLVVNTYQSEKCMYGRRVFNCLYCVDCAFVQKCELCYECFDCKNCYNGSFLQDCESCTDSEYLVNCKSCKNCFCSMNLRRKQFFIFNVPYSEDEYFEKIQGLKKLGRKYIESEFEKVKMALPHEEFIGENNEKSVGDHIFDNKNCEFVFDSNNNQDCLYSNELLSCEDCADITIGEFSKWNYDCLSSYKLHNSNFCVNCWESSDLEYCEHCYRCEHCLFCVNLHHKKFYIFNKQLSEEEYFAEKAKILQEMRQDLVYGKHIPSTYPVEDTMACG